MADVARVAGVSIKTVSRVVNDEPGVGAATLARVRAVIDDLAFQRHDAASSLRSGRSQSIGLIVDDLANPFFARLTAAVERQARLHHHLLIGTSSERSPDNEADLVDALVSRRVDALVVVPSGATASAALEAAARSIPVVCVDRPLPGLAVDVVLSDNEGGVRSAVEHLVARRHERLAFLGDDGSVWTSRRRRDAFAAAVRSLDLPAPLRMQVGPYATGELPQILKDWTHGASPVTALITGNNRVTVAALRTMKQQGLSMSVVGYDDFDLADVVEPPVTVVHQDPDALGERAIQQVFARLASARGAPKTIVVPTRLIVRESSWPLTPTAARASRGTRRRTEKVL